MVKQDREGHRTIDLKANKECVGGGVKTLEREVYPCKFGK